jgi:adenylate kinase
LIADDVLHRLRMRCRRECVVVISGVPGTGKSTVAARLSRLLGWELVNLSETAIKLGLILEEDKERNTYVVDEGAVRAWVRKKSLEQPLIVDSHYGEIVDDDILLKIFVLRLRPDILLKRLLERGWDLRKVAENVEAELLGVCTSNALEEHPKEKVCEIDATGKTPEEIVEDILLILAGRKNCVSGIDWLSVPEVVESTLSFLTKLENPRKLNK